MKSIEQWLSGVERFGSISDVIFRVLFSLIFVVGGLGHFFRLQEMLTRIEESPWADVVRTTGNPSVSALAKWRGICRLWNFIRVRLFDATVGFGSFRHACASNDFNSSRPWPCRRAPQKHCHSRRLNSFLLSRSGELFDR